MLTSRHALERKKKPLWGVIAGGEGFSRNNSKMSESRILVRLLRMYFPQSWEFGSALSKLRNFRGGGFEHPKPPPRYATGSLSLESVISCFSCIVVFVCTILRSSGGFLFTFLHTGLTEWPHIQHQYHAKYLLVNHEKIKYCTIIMSRLGRNTLCSINSRQ